MTSDRQAGLPLEEASASSGEAAVALRKATADDIEAFYAISLATGDRGDDAAALYRDPRMLGHIYSAPYLTLCPEHCFVAEDGDGVGGYIVGTLDTRAFEARLEQDWWPALRRRYPPPEGEPKSWDADQRRCSMIHNPRCAPDEIVRGYPGHVHMNLLPRLQGRGLGPALLDLWLSNAQARGCPAVHIATSATNPRALHFWTARGFAEVLQTSDHGSSGTIWCGRSLALRG